ncbi:hypothetical protein RBS60_13090 [Sinomonas sp. ASV486]|uniref:hypothetical protein n=1 Tax=Sinomonas sp. ASV486 TaxID=3051170 RepID=UPI0027DBA7E2|nr:hypothetical protein [Sinomonas sp. ASV486]MDQ4491132.1 hypothetical protein [Sinomonas sp. ASV486]
MEAKEELAPDEQVSCYHWFLRAAQKLARTGKPIHKDSYNQLRDGIWELKHANLRISFYDTDGSGHYDPLIDRESYGPWTTRPWPDDFLEFLRLTTAFEKLHQPEHITLAKQVRKEDLAHDQEQEERDTVSGGAA